MQKLSESLQTYSFFRHIDYNMDFTLKKYRELLTSFRNAGYSFVSVEQFLNEEPKGKVIILRHDVDELAENAMAMAKVEKNLGITATYYFRKVKQSDKPSIIREMAHMGVEIGYHYEDLSKAEGDMDVAMESFRRNLEYFRTYYPVKTVCMHGSSSSKYDNRDIWETHKLEDFDLLGEPYLSVDFNKVFYLTDTGYAWDGGKYAVRDVVHSPFPQKYHSSDEIIYALKMEEFPEQAMILAHTLWTGSMVQWVVLHIREFIRNRVKLLAKNHPCIKVIYSNIVKAYWK